MTPLDGDIAEPQRDLSPHPREEGDQPPQSAQDSSFPGNVRPGKNTDEELAAGGQSRGVLG